MKTPKWCTAVAAVVLGTVAGCSASYDERMDYLKTIAQQGVEIHDLITSQEGDVNEKRCEAAFAGVSDYIEDAPDVNGVDQHEAWQAQIKQFFVDSCVSGVPKEIEAPGKTESPDQDS